MEKTNAEKWFEAQADIIVGKCGCKMRLHQCLERQRTHNHWWEIEMRDRAQRYYALRAEFIGCKGCKHYKTRPRKEYEQFERRDGFFITSEFEELCA